MVAKPIISNRLNLHGLNLAKIHMVAKLGVYHYSYALSLNLAKIHMVAKHRARDEVQS